MRLPKILLAACMLLSFGAHAESPSIPATVVPKNYKVVETIRGDLNKDGQEDIVLLIKATDLSQWVKDERGQKVDRNRRGLIVLLKNGEKYEPVLKNLNCFASENEDGGVYFPPELEILIKKSNLLIEYGHGRYGYWTYTFRLQNGDFELIGYDHSSNRGPVVESFTSINLLSQKMLRKINTNQDAQGGDERFKESWSKLKPFKPIRLAAITAFDEFSVERVLGVSD